MGGYILQITLSNEIIVQNPTPEIIKFCTDSLVLPNPEYYKKQRMGFWLGNTPATLSLYRRNGNKYLIPYGSWNDLKKMAPPGTPINTDLASNPTVDYGTKLPLYDYQETAVNSITQRTNGILQAPCGSGKTQMGIQLTATLGKKTLWLTHTTDLLNQSYERAAQYMDKSLLGKITGGKVNISEGITFATVQTLSKVDLSQYKYTWDVVIVDECHRVAGSPTSLTMFSKVINSLAAPYKYGLSATVHRGDGLIKSTFALLGEVIYQVSKDEIADKTMDVTIQKVNTDVTISESCLDTDGTVIFSELINYLVENETRSKLIAAKIAENRNHSNMILSDRLQHLRELITCLLNLGIPADQIRMIDGEMTGKKAKAERKQALDDMKSGDAKFLFLSYSLGKEGLDIPNLDRLYLTIPHKNFTVVTQSIGRIERTSDNKDSAICYDFVDNIESCVKSWKQRKSIYKKNGCVILEDAAQTTKPSQMSLFQFTA